MDQNFFDYLEAEGCLNRKELDKTQGLDKEGYEKKSLFFLYFFSFKKEQLEKVNNFINEFPEVSFKEAVIKLDMAAENDINAFDESDELTYVAQGQMLADMGLLPLERISELLTDYKINVILENSKAFFAGEQTAEAFLGEYLSIVKDGFFLLYDIDIAYGEIQTHMSIETEVLVYQKIFDSKGVQFITGIISDESVFKNAGRELYDWFNSGMEIPSFGNTKEDAIDFFCEFLNSANGFCTYKFNVDFDLEPPGFHEGAVLTAPRLYTAEMTVLSDTMKIFMVYGDACNFERKV